MLLLNHKDRTRAPRFNPLFSKRRVKVEHDFKEMKTYKAIGRFGGTHAGSCLCAWSYLFFYLKEKLDSLKQSRSKIRRKLNSAIFLQTHSNFECYNEISSCFSTFLLVHVSIIYLFLSSSNRHIAVVVAKLCFQAASGICSTKKS